MIYITLKHMVLSVQTEEAFKNKPPVQHFPPLVPCPKRRECIKANTSARTHKKISPLNNRIRLAFKIKPQFPSCFGYVPKHLVPHN